MWMVALLGGLSYGAVSCLSLFFFSHAPAGSDIYPLSLHDALPISQHLGRFLGVRRFPENRAPQHHRRVGREHQDRKSTRLNSSHGSMSYAVCCLKKKKIRSIDVNILMLNS